MIKIRNYTDADKSSFVTLLIECQRYHHQPVPKEAEVEYDLSNLPIGVEILLAEDGDKIVGFAAFSTLYPGPITRPHIYLKEIFVRRHYGGEGVAKKFWPQLFTTF